MNAFVQTGTSLNIKGDWTEIDSPLATDKNALVFAMPRISSLGGSAVYNIPPIGVWYVSPWAVFNEDQSPMPEGAEFNILILQAR